MKCRLCHEDRERDDFPLSPTTNRRLQSCNSCRQAIEDKRAGWRRDGRECYVCGETRECPGEIADVDRCNIVCKPCQRERMNETQRIARAKPAARAAHNESSKQWRKRHPEKMTEANRKWREKVRQDPERWRELRENRRIAYRLRRERKGLPVRKPMSEEAYNARYGTGFGRAATLPAEALRDHVVNAATAMGSREEFARLAGVSDRRLQDMVNGVTHRVSLVNADKLCVALGIPLHELVEEAEDAIAA